MTQATTSQFRLEALEPRVLLSGDDPLDLVAAEPVVDAAQVEVIGDEIPTGWSAVDPLSNDLWDVSLEEVPVESLDSVALGSDLIESRQSAQNSSPLPEWVELGPRRIEGAGHLVEGFDMSTVSGAVQTIAIDPENPNRVYVGTVNGGIWRTDTISAPAPAWTPLSDDDASLAISHIAFYPDRSQSILAGTGNLAPR